jgi:hypothetical protein
MAKEGNAKTPPARKEAGSAKSIEAGWELLAADAFMMPFDCRRFFPLPFGSGLFVKFTGAQFGEQTNLFDRTLEAAQGGFERLIFADSNTGHENFSFARIKLKLLQCI